MQTPVSPSSADSPEEPLELQVESVAKSFPGVLALSDVDMDVRPGEVHALVGENGAGKSTLIKILAGLYAPDHGTIRINGREVSIDSASEARSHGLEFIHQDLNLVPAFSAVENMALGLPVPRRAGVLVDWPALHRQARKVADRVGADFDLHAPVKNLSQAQRVMVAICRALMLDSRVITMDEPTAALSGSEVQRLFALVRELQSQGVAVIYVSHRLEEVFELADRVTVLKDGHLVGTFPLSEIDGEGDLTKLIIGHTLEEMIGTREGQPRETRLMARNLCWRDRIHDVSLELRAGEILGLGGLVGAGRSELAHLLFGAERPDTGEIEIGGSTASLRSPKHAIAQGMALVPEDRRGQAGVMEMSIRENATLTSLHSYKLGPFIANGRERAAVRELVGQFGVKSSSIENPLRELSGGNQQKVIIGKWVHTGADIYIFDEPTQGVDVGAKREIFQIIEDLADSGAAVLFISSELEEVAGISDRVLVMREGRIVAELKNGDVTVSGILEHCYGTAEPPAPANQ